MEELFDARIRRTRKNGQSYWIVSSSAGSRCFTALGPALTYIRELLPFLDMLQAIG